MRNQNKNEFQSRIEMVRDKSGEWIISMNDLMTEQWKTARKSITI